MRRYADEIRERQAVIKLEAQVDTDSVDVVVPSLHLLCACTPDAMMSLQKSHTGLASRKAATSAPSRDELLAEQTALFKQASLDAAKEGW